MTSTEENLSAETSAALSTRGVLVRPEQTRLDDLLTIRFARFNLVILGYRSNAGRSFAASPSVLATHLECDT